MPSTRSDSASASIAFAAATLVRNASATTPSPGGSVASDESSAWRVPGAMDIQDMLDKGVVPESDIRSGVAMALKRMQYDKLLKTSDSIEDIVKRLFPQPGTFDADALAGVVDVASLSHVYGRAVAAELRVRTKDRQPLLNAMAEASGDIDDAVANPAGLKQVFGDSKVPVAQAVYGKAKAAITEVQKDLDKHVDVDYNLDDSQVGQRGRTNRGARHIHLAGEIATVADPAQTRATIVHECAHLADESVTDRGYYGTEGFEAMAEDEKVANAAHYEELPRRKSETSKYPDLTFTPGRDASGAAVDFASGVRRDVSERIRKARSASTEIFRKVRLIHVAVASGVHGLFAQNRGLLEAISKHEGLTIHKQTPEPHTVTVLDVVLSEGIAHGLMRVEGLAKVQPVPASPAKGMTKEAYVAEVLAAAAKAYDNLTGDPKSDKDLIHWLVKYYDTGVL